MRQIRILLLVIFLLSPTVCYGSNGIDIEANIGFSKRYKVQNLTPFEITLTNHGQDFSGELQIEISLTNETYRKEHEIHAVSLELPQNSSKLVELELTVPTIQHSFEIKLVDKKGQTVANKIEVLKAMEPSGLLFGILSDNNEALNFMKQMKFFMDDNAYTDYNNYTYSAQYPYPAQQESTYMPASVGDRLIFFDENTLPKSAPAISNFNIILINDFDTKRLSKEQTEALSSWVKSGGILCVGTGENYAKTTSGLSDLLDGVVLTGEPEYFDGLTLASFNVPEEAEGYFPYTKAFRKGDGMIILHRFDAGLDTFSKRSEASELLSEIYRPYLHSTIMQGNNYYNNNVSWLLRRLPSLSGELLNAIILIMFAYILFIGPVLYFILKKKDIREKGLYIIPAISLAVTLTIYFLSSTTLYGNPILNTISITRLKDDAKAVSSDVYLMAFSPQKGNTTVEYPLDLTLKKASSDDYYRYYSSYNQGSQVKSVLTKKVNYDEKVKITYYDNKKWDKSYSEANMTLNLDGLLDAEFYIDGELLKGKITNNTGYNFEDTVIALGNKTFIYGGLDNGQSIDISEEFSLEDSNYNYNYGYNIFTSDHDWNELINLYGEQRTFDMYLRNDIIRNILTDTANQYDVNIYAITGENIFPDFYINGRVPYTISNNVFAVSAAIDFTNSATTVIPFGIIKPEPIQTIQGSADQEQDSIYIYGDDTELLVSFKVPDGFDSSAFEIYWHVYDGELEIYNAQNDEWESFITFIEYNDNAYKYVGEDGLITLRLSGMSSQYLDYPMIKLLRRHSE